MKKLTSAGIGLFILVMTSHPALALRCGNNLVMVGDLKHDVLLKCGEPKSKELIGFIDHLAPEMRVRVMKIEEWIVEENHYGHIYYHSLMFEGNRLKEITPAGRKK